MIGTILLASSALVSGPLAADVQVAVTMPSIFVHGGSYVVDVTYTSGDEAVALDAWRLTAAAFEVDKKPLGERPKDATIELPAGSSMTLHLDLSSYLEVSGSFKLSLFGADKESTTEVGVYQAAAEGLDFMTIDEAELANYFVMIQTEYGPILAEMYPDTAPNHVRNFLDLSYTGFYEGTQFHRVSPTFMIQGGCPETKTSDRKKWGTGSGPRMLEAEFNRRKHVPGILSMARGPSPNSASCQFFIMTAKNPGLDKQYSVFGNVISGYDAVEKIANARGSKQPDTTVRPTQPQMIQKTVVLTRG